MKQTLSLIALLILAAPLAAQTDPSVSGTDWILQDLDSPRCTEQPATDGDCTAEEAILDPEDLEAPMQDDCVFKSETCTGYYYEGNCCFNGRKELERECFRCYTCESGRIDCFTYWPKICHDSWCT